MTVPAAGPRRIAAPALLLITVLTLSGCQLPRSGPMLSEMTGAHEKDVIVMPVSRELARASQVADVADFPVRYRDLTQAGFDRLVPGDGINVKVWERGGLGVFAADPSGVSDLGVQELDRNGNVSFPILGKFQAGGMTLAQLHDAIVVRLSRLVAGADVSVTRAADARGQMVTVQGNLTKPGMYPITQTAQRLSSALAQAAPVQTNPEQLVISLRRDNQVASVRLSDIYRNQNNDILLRSGDVITAYESREFLTVLGAAGNQGRVAISKRNYSVLDALADARAWTTRPPTRAPSSCSRRPRPASRQAGPAAGGVPVRPHAPGTGGAGARLQRARRPGHLHLRRALHPGAEGAVGLPRDHERGLQRHPADRRRQVRRLRRQPIAFR